MNGKLTELIFDRMHLNINQLHAAPLENSSMAVYCPRMKFRGAIPENPGWLLLVLVGIGVLALVILR